MDGWMGGLMDVWVAPLGFCRIVDSSVSHKRVSFTEKLTRVYVWRLELSWVSKRQRVRRVSCCVIERQKRFHLLGVCRTAWAEQETFQRIKNVGRFSMVVSIVVLKFYDAVGSAVSAENSAAAGLQVRYPGFRGLT
jgi:hypothetical protein